MNIEEISFLQSALKIVLNEDFEIAHIKAMIEKRNKVFITKLAQLVKSRDQRLIRSVISIFYNEGLFEQLIMILSMGDIELSKILFKFLLQKEDGLKVLGKILIPSLISCTYNINVLDEREKVYIENIWRTFLKITDAECRKLATLAYKTILNDEGLNKVMKNAILGAYHKVFPK